MIFYRAAANLPFHLENIDLIFEPSLKFQFYIWSYNDFSNQISIIWQTQSNQGCFFYNNLSRFHILWGNHPDSLSGYGPNFIDWIHVRFLMHI